MDGRPAGETPTVVDLERTQSHVLTLQKESYRQADVVIQRKKKVEEQLFKAINSGVTTGMMFKDPAMGMMRAMDAYSTQEKTGEAYELWPSAVTVDLQPLGAPKAGPLQNDAGGRAGGAGPGPASGQTGQDQGETGAMIKGALAGAAVGGTVALGTGEKRWETSSSSRTTVRPDGTVETTRSSSSVGVSVNPVGVEKLINTLYK